MRQGKWQTRLSLAFCLISIAISAVGTILVLLVSPLWFIYYFLVDLTAFTKGFLSAHNNQQQASDNIRQSIRNYSARNREGSD